MGDELEDCDDLLDGDDDHEVGHMAGIDDLDELSDEEERNKRQLDMELGVGNFDEIDEDLGFDLDMHLETDSLEKEKEPVPSARRENVDSLIESPPGLNLFTKIKDSSGFKHFNLEDLSLERDFEYSRRGKLKGHGFSDQTIQDILSDKLLFVRHLMPEAESVLLCDKHDFKVIMDFLFYSISVCTERRLADLLVKSFFDLAKNYGFSWRLTLKHVVTVLNNYAVHPHVLEGMRCGKHLPKYRHAPKRYELKTHRFYSKRMKRNTAFTPVPEDKFTLCVSNFILFISEFTAGLPSRMNLRDKSDWSDLCVFTFLINLIGTDQRFVENFKVVEAISTMYVYLFDSVPPENWYCGDERVDKNDGRILFTKDSFPSALATMIHDFPHEDEMNALRCWKPEKYIHEKNNEHRLNVIHKLGLFPPSYRANQVRRFLAFYYLQTALVAKLSAPVNPSVIDIAENRAILDNTALKIMWNKSNHNFSKLLVVVKLLNIVVGEEVKEAFSADKIPSIRLVLKEVLGKMKRKLPSVQTGLKTNNIITLAQLHSHLDVVIDRWTSGCGDN